MDRPRSWPLLCVMLLLALNLVATAQDGQVKRRLTPKEIQALPTESAGAGTGTTITIELPVAQAAVSQMESETDE